jgi:hypothetical protein
MSSFKWKSSDGYYGIALGQLQGDGSHRMSRYSAFHIEALWAKPAPIGGGPSLTEAKQVCDQHREREGAPA